MRWWFRELATGGIALLILALAATAVEVLGQDRWPREFGSLRRASGASVAPTFIGWELNPDGTFTLYWGYNNRNWAEEVDIPVGPNNFFAPGPQDRGQPTHFMLRVQKRIFSFVVPADFPTTERLVWTLIRGPEGEPQTAAGSLTPIYAIEALKTQGGNEAPTVDAGADQAMVLPQRATLTAVVQDDGRPQRGRGRFGRSGAGASRLTVQWRLYRGPGPVSFSDVTSPVGADGKATTTVTFSEPGVYVIQAIAQDGSTRISPEGNTGGFCCFSDDTVTIDIKEAQGP